MKNIYMMNGIHVGSNLPARTEANVPIVTDARKSHKEILHFQTRIATRNNVSGQ
jgi:hypothetical protein